MLESLGEWYVDGADIDWRGFDRGYAREKRAMPTYPFERTRHWPDPLAASITEAPRLHLEEHTTVAPVEPVPVSIQTPAMVEPQPIATLAAAPASVEPAVPRRERLVEQVRSLLEQISGMSLADADPSAPFVALGSMPSAVMSAWSLS